MAPELSEQAGFLHLFFEDAQCKVDVVIVYFNNAHGATNDWIGGGALPGVLPD